MKREIRYDKIRTYFKLNIGVVILLAITSTAFNIGMAYVPTFQGKVIDAFNDGKDFSYVWHIAMYFILFLLFVQVNRFIKRLLRRRFANRMMLQMRTKTFGNLLLDDIDNFSSAKYGDIMNRQLADIRDASEAIETTLAEVFDSGVLLGSYFVFMALVDFKLAAICMVFPISVIFVAVAFGPRIRRYTREYKEVYGKTKRENLTVLQNEIYYRGFGINKNYYDKYEATLDDLEVKAVKNTIFRTSFEPLYLGIAALGYVFAFYYGGLHVVRGTWALGTFTAFIGSFTFARKKCGFVGRIINNIQTGFVSWKRCKGMLGIDIPSRELEAPNNDGLYVSNLTFGYDEAFKLEGINFEAHKGEIIGVCGKIRSGKTTLAGALSGVYEYDGSITLNGIELKDVVNDRIKSFIHYAPGKVEIFNDTLEYNITFGAEGDFWKACETACLTEDVNAFPSREKEMLSHSLLNISGGQQRRLQIARCVFNSPALVILDDPFNAIGIEMSIDIINNLKKNYPDSIFIVINNQSESLKYFDKVLFLENRTGLFDTYENMMRNESFKALMGGDL